MPRQLISEAFDVTERLRQITFTNSWIGSDIEMRLTGPSGRQILRGNEDSDVTSDRGASYETVSVLWPEPGEWTVEFYGLDVPPEGEPFTFSTVELKDPNEPPVAAFEVTQGEPGTVMVDGSGSTDESEVVGYEFFFADGAVAEGPQATHSYEASGTYEIVLMAVDDDLGTSLARQTVQVEVPEDQTGTSGAPTTTTPPVVTDPNAPSSGDDPASSASTTDPVPTPAPTAAPKPVAPATRPGPAKNEVAAPSPLGTSSTPAATVGSKTQPNQTGGLAATGAQIRFISALAGMALVLGVTMLLTARRRRQNSAE